MKKGMLLTVTALFALAAVRAEEIKPEVVFDADFEFAEVGEHLPPGFSRFFASQIKDKNQAALADAKLYVAEDDAGNREAVVDDRCPETGIGYLVRLNAMGGKTYRATVEARPLPGRDLKLSYLQLTDGKKPVQIQLNSPAEGQKYAVTRIICTLPAEAKQLTCYVYTHYASKAGIAINRLTIEELDPSATAVLFREDFKSSPAGAALPPDHSRFFASKLKEHPEAAKVKMAVLETKEGKEFAIEDDCDQTGVGITRIFAATPGTLYTLKVVAKPLPGRSMQGAVLQLRGLPSNKLTQKQLATPPDGKEWKTSTVAFTLPENDTRLQYYVYTNYPQTPGIAVKEIEITAKGQ